MTRFAWLQARTQTLVAGALLATLAVIAAITGVQMSHLFHSSVANCSPGQGCGFAISEFLSHNSFMDHALDILARVVPVLLGMFWGAPLAAREFESGTHRLAWTQSVSRSRWVATKLAVGGLATVAVAGLLTLTVTWWYTSRDQVGGANPFAVLDRRDIAPVTYAAFAFASGALLGAIIRRTVPAIAATLGLFVFVRVAISIWVRPHLLRPLHEAMSLLAAHQIGFTSSNGSGPMLEVRDGGPPRAYVLSTHLVNSAGHLASAAERTAFVRDHCPGVIPPPPSGPGHAVAVPDLGAVKACQAQAAQTFHLLVTYHPSSRYWAFQWLESGVFVALALLAAAACYWWVTRRAT